MTSSKLEVDPGEPRSMVHRLLFNDRGPCARQCTQPRPVMCFQVLDFFVNSGGFSPPESAFLRDSASHISAMPSKKQVRSIANDIVEFSGKKH